MSNRIARTSLVGALAGALVALGIILLLTPQLLGKVTATPLDDGTARVSPVFEITGSTIALPHILEIGDTVIFENDWDITPLTVLSMWAVVGFGIGGLLTVFITIWAPTAFDAQAAPPRRPWTAAFVGLGTGAAIGLLAANGAVTWYGETTAISIQVGVFRGLAIAVIFGAVLGMSVAVTTHLLARPDVLGVEDGAWETPRETVTAMGQAVSIPLIAMVGIAVLVLAFGALLLALTHEIALVLAGAVAAAILGLASLAAYGPPRR